MSGVQRSAMASLASKKDRSADRARPRCRAPSRQTCKCRSCTNNLQSLHWHGCVPGRCSPPRAGYPRLHGTRGVSRDEPSSTRPSMARHQPADHRVRLVSPWKRYGQTSRNMFIPAGPGTDPAGLRPVGRAAGHEAGGTFLHAIVAAAMLGVLPIVPSTWLASEGSWVGAPRPACWPGSSAAPSSSSVR